MKFFIEMLKSAWTGILYCLKFIFIEQQWIGIIVTIFLILAILKIIIPSKK